MQKGAQTPGSAGTPTPVFWKQNYAQSLNLKSYKNAHHFLEGTYLNELPVVLLTSYHKLSALEQQKCPLSVLEASNVKSVSLG